MLVRALLASAFLSAAPALLPSPAKLTWSPPALDRPEIITLTVGADGRPGVRVSPGGKTRVGGLPTGHAVIELPADRDAIIKLPPQTLRLRELDIRYGRRVQVIGGHLEASAPADTKNRALLRFGGQKESIFVEGLLIDCNDQYGLDGIEVGGLAHQDPIPQADFYLQNTAILGVAGAREGLHADGFQFYGDMGRTFMDRVSVRSQYQGLFLAPQHETGAITLKHIDVDYTDPKNGNGYAFYLREGPEPRRPTVSLEEVYVGARENAGKWEMFSVYPPARMKTGVRRKGGVGSFPAFPEIKGRVILGRPREGSFAPRRLVGTGYVSPGYLQAAGAE